MLSLRNRRREALVTLASRRNLGAVSGALVAGAQVAHGYGGHVEGDEEDVYDVHPTPLTAGVAAEGHVGAGAIEEAKTTTSDVIKVLGWGFLIWVGLKYVAPQFLGAAKETKRASHELGSIGRTERERREELAIRRHREAADWRRDWERGGGYERPEPRRSVNYGSVPNAEIEDDAVEGVLIR